jgi:tetratricopeptide (TPR) repeat protein
MSEWYDSQRKPSSDLRRLLKERFEQANPRRTELSKHETKRLERLEAIVENLKRGKNVQNRQLQTWLTEGEYAEFEQAWAEQQQLREELKDKRSELKRYEEKLKQATFYYNRAEGYSSKGKHKTAKSFYAKSETCCEQAIEILQEIMHSNPYLQTWFDRHISFDVEDGIGAEIGSLPRLVTSRSHESLGQDSRITSKLDVKLSVVERAIDRIGRD